MNFSPPLTPPRRGISFFLRVHTCGVHPQTLRYAEEPVVPGLWRISNRDRKGERRSREPFQKNHPRAPESEGEHRRCEPSGKRKSPSWEGLGVGL